MADDPDVGVGVHVGNVVIQVLHRSPHFDRSSLVLVRTPHREEEHGSSKAHRSYSVKERVISQSLLNTSLLALPSAPITVTHGRPGPVNSGTTTAE